MATINPTPITSCDVCGKQVKMEPTGIPEASRAWKRPLRWGSVKISPTRHDQYPNNIAMLDVCPECLENIHNAVDAMIDSIRHIKQETIRHGVG